MKRALYALLGITALLVVISASASATDANYFSISKKLGNKNVDPNVAININGNVLVTWTSRADDESFGKIYAALVKQKNGKPIISKARLVSSGAPGELNRHPDVAYDNLANTFCIVWSKQYKVNGNSQTDINMRVVNVSGKPVGKIIPLVSQQNSDNYHPEILPLPHSLITSGEPDSYFIICWFQKGYDPDSPDAGLYKAIINGNGVLQGDAELLLKAHTFPDSSIGDCIPDDFIPSQIIGESFYLAFRYFAPAAVPGAVNAEPVFNAAVAQFDMLGNKVGIVTVDSYEGLDDMRIGQLGDKLYLATWSRSYSGETLNQAIISKPARKKKSYKPFNLESWGSDIVSIETVGAIQFICNYGTVHYQVFNIKGKKAGKSVKTTAFGGYDFRSERLGYSDYYLNVFVQDTKEFKSEIAGSIVYIDSSK